MGPLNFLKPSADHKRLLREFFINLRDSQFDINYSALGPLDADVLSVDLNFVKYTFSNFMYQYHILRFSSNDMLKPLILVN